MPGGQELFQASIVVQVFGLGLRGVLGELASLPQQPVRLARVLVARDLLIPVVVMAALACLRLPRSAVIGATLLAISPGALVIPQILIARRGQPEMGLGSSPVAALCSFVIVPFWLPIVGWLLVGDAAVAPATAARLAAVLFVLPLALGVMVRRLGSVSMTAASGPMLIAAELLVWVSLVPLLGDTLQALPELGLPFVATVLCAPSLAVLGGVCARRWISLGRSELLHVGSVRHPGFALLIASSNFAGETVLPAVVVSFVGGLLASVLYAVLTRESYAGLGAAPERNIVIALDETASRPTPRPR